MRFKKKLDSQNFVAVFLAIACAGNIAIAARDSHRTDQEDPFARGTQLSASKKYEEAAVQYELAMQADPAFIPAYTESARAYVLSGKRKEGLKRLEIGLQAARRKSDIEKLKEQRKLLSEIFYTNSTFQKYQDGLNNMKGMKLRAAIESLEQALATEPDNVLIMVSYAKALQAVDDWKESASVLEQAFALNPDEKEARVLLATALHGTNPDRTLQLLKPVIDDAKEATEAAVVPYAQALAKKGDLKNAIAVLQKDVDKHTERLKSLYWLGKFHSDIPESRWIARKHLQTFLKRTEHPGEFEELKDLQQEAHRIVDRIHTELGIDATVEKK